MMYFNDITDLEQAKQHYRTFAKQLHPDKGGTALEFQKMQDEYKTLLLQLQQNREVVIQQNQSDENELLSELGKLAKVLIKKQVPQNYLRHKSKKIESPIIKDIFEDMVNFLDEL